MDYRLYCHDGAEKLWVADGIQADSIDEVIAVALRLRDIFKCEVWQNNRLVAKIEGGTATLIQPMPDLEDLMRFRHPL